MPSQYLPFSRRILGFSLASSFALGLSACHEEPTEVVVQVHTDLSCDVKAAIAAGPVGEVGNRSPSAESTRCDPETGSLGQVVIVPKASKNSPVAIEVRVRPDKGSPDQCLEANGYDGCIVARRIFNYIDQRTVTMRVDLKNPCVNTPCSSTTTCVAQGLSKSCVDAVVDLKSCKNGCSDAELVQSSPCSADAIQCGENAERCDVVGDGAHCVCKPGFANPSDSQTSCSDVDECASGGSGCDANATCTNTAGSFSCACNAGYKGDGKTCTKVLPTDCATPCDANSTCQQQGAGFACVCNPGYALNGGTCVDIDECATSADNCAEMNASCENTPGSFKCNCAASQVMCSSECIEPASDPRFCGATLGCGVDSGSAGDVCSPAQTCENGSCQCPSPFPMLHSLFMPLDTPVALAKINGDDRADLILPKAVKFADAGGGFLRDFADVGNGPFAVGDLNDDAIPDTVTMRYFPHAISASILGADGVKSLKETALDGMNMLTAIAISDLDGDRLGDLALARNAGPISIYFGNGDGSFSADKEFAASDVSALSFGDFDGDGEQDLAVLQRATSKVSILFGTGDSNIFTAAKDIATAEDPSSLAITDLDADGRSDLLLTSRIANTAQVFYGAANRSFDNKLELVVGTAPSAIVSGDLNGDGAKDLVVANEGDIVPNGGTGTLSVLLAKPTVARSFDAAKSVRVGYRPLFLALGDTNGDGRLDVGVTNRRDNARSAPDSYLHILPGNGDGTFAEVFLELGIGPAIAHDFNGDGKVDVVRTQSMGAANQMSLYLGRGDGTWEWKDVVGQYGVDGAAQASDLDGDGVLDLVVRHGTGVDVELNKLKESDSFVRVGSEGDPAAPNLTMTNFALGDISGDNKTDLVAANGASIALYLGLGNGRFDESVKLTAESDVEKLTLAKLNADNRLDVIAKTSDKVWVFLSDGAIGTAFKPAVDVGAGVEPQHVHAGDLNNDGLNDLVVRTRTNLAVLLGKGAGEFAARTTIATNGTPASSVLADVNVDGRLDILFTNESAARFSLLLGNGNGSFKAATTFPLIFENGILATADFTNDGRPDVLANGLQVVPGAPQCP